jgi:hypothetical protein
MKRKTAVAVTILTALAAACSSGIVEPGGTTGHDVSIAVDVPGVCIVGGCDPVSAEVHTLALIRIQNLGATTAFLRACGTQPALEEQQFVGGSWVSVGPAISCPLPSTPIPLAAGDSLRLNAFYAKGTRRVVMSVGGNASLSDEVLATSGAFVIR